MTYEGTRFAKLLELADAIEGFPVGRCSPFDDPEKQTGYAYAFKEIAHRFVGNARRVKNAAFQEALAQIDPQIGDWIAEVCDLRFQLLNVIEDLRELANQPQADELLTPGAPFVAPSVIQELRSTTSPKYDLNKVARLCEELNSSYTNGNVLAATLLIRALINHVPPIFGHTTFAQVVSHATRSVKPLLRVLDESSRDVADLHSHALVRRKETLPSLNQVEPFKPNVEVLLHEIIARVSEAV